MLLFYSPGTSFDLSKKLCISVEVGNYGQFIRIKKEQRWICFSTQVWSEICRNIIITNSKILHQTESKIELTKDKEMNVVKFLNQFYVSFTQRSVNKGKMYTNYINFNSSEWSALLYTLPALDAALQGYDVPDTVRPETEIKYREKQQNCTLCKGTLKAVITHDNLMNKTTKLNQMEYESVQESNKTAYNQMAYSCTYCGKSICEDCHCHRFDCKMCEPTNFCDKCDEIIVYKSKYSDL